MKMKIFISSLLIVLSSNLYAAVDYFFLKKADNEQIKITIKDLEELPTYSFTTATNFTPKDIFLGVKFKDFAEKYKISGEKVRAFAWDDYSYTIPVDEMIKYNVIIAYKKGGNYLDITDLGPFAIVYPIDLHPELNNLDANAKTVWQLKLMNVKLK